MESDLTGQGVRTGFPMFPGLLSGAAETAVVVFPPPPAALSCLWLEQTLGAHFPTGPQPIPETAQCLPTSPTTGLSLALGTKGRQLDLGLLELGLSFPGTGSSFPKCLPSLLPPPNHPGKHK